MTKDEEKKIRKSVLDILRENELLSLATYNKRKKQPSICSLYYTYNENLIIYYWSEKNANHSKNLVDNSHVAVNIAKSTQEWGSSLKGLKIYGTVKEANNNELFIGGMLYIKRFKGVRKFVKIAKDFNSKIFNSKLYVIKPIKIIVLDEKQFGKEVYKEINIK
ncbi:hypothetical protein AUJ84_01450 [Candidatus Pacearchaeota archaeon CG1_02_32_132]|nr:MAG: hypothetical protein AUJ84_01450 [Candidatus Pacearchaeota archaeon CG1_02_32_132]